MSKKGEKIDVGYSKGTENPNELRVNGRLGAGRCGTYQCRQPISSKMLSPFKTRLNDGFDRRRVLYFVLFDGFLFSCFGCLNDETIIFLGRFTVQNYKQEKSGKGGMG